MPYRICLISLGCAKNQVNSEQMLYLLNQAGHEVVGEVDGATSPSSTPAALSTAPRARPSTRSCSSPR